MSEHPVQHLRAFLHHGMQLVRIESQCLQNCRSHLHRFHRTGNHCRLEVRILQQHDYIRIIVREAAVFCQLLRAAGIGYANIRRHQNFLTFAPRAKYFCPNVLAVLHMPLLFLRNVIFVMHFSARKIDRACDSPLSSDVPSIRCSAVLFDMDGVLVDSTPAVARVWRSWAEQHGFDPDVITRQAHGRPSIETMRELLPHGDYVAETAEVERREREDFSDIVALPGAAELLRALPEDRWTIVTSATRELAELRLRVTGLPIPKIFVTASDLQNGKPHPEPYLKGAAALRTHPRDCLVIEDAPSGIHSGKAAGARVLALSTTIPAAELLAAGADWLAPNLASLSLTEISSSHLLFSLTTPR